MKSTLRSVLFVPGSRPERFVKACNAGADMVCIDLEDAVLPKDKEQARQHVVDFIATDPDVCVRMNAVDTQEGQRDLKALGSNMPAAIMMAKCESAQQVLAVAQIAGDKTQLIPLIETLEGLEKAAEIAQASPSISHLMFGGADMAAELGCEFSYEPLLCVRSQLVFAAAKAGVGVIDVPFIDIKNLPALEQEATKVKALGFTAKAAIHPGQIQTIHQAFMPTAEQIEYAQAVMAQVDSPDAGVIVVNGKMIDRPVILACQRTLALAALAK